MLKKFIYLAIILTSIFSFSQETKTITEYRKESDTVLKVRKSFFNKKGKLVKEIYFEGYDSISKTFRNRIKNITYHNNRKILETSCELFISSDTCITLPFSKYSYNNKLKTEKQIFYDSDSLIISITETKNLKRKKYITIYAWDFEPVKEPNYKTAFIIHDTILLDRKGRIIKSLRYKKEYEKPIMTDIYEYNKNGYTLQRESYGRKSTITMLYSKQQFWANKRNLEYNFSNDQKYHYEFESY